MDSRAIQLGPRRVAWKGFASIVEKGTSGINPFSSDDLTRSIWREFVKIADQYDEPGRFTAMTGFEWSSTPDGDNLHRVVVFRDGAEQDRAGNPVLAVRQR